MIKPGDLAKDFELINYQGKKVKLFDRLYTHTPLFLVFYKNECPTCQFTFPFLARISRLLGPDHFLAVAQDTPDEARDFRSQYNFNFDVVCDTHPYPTSVAYGVEFVPTAFIIESDKKISYVMEGFEKKAIEDFAKRIAATQNLSSFDAFDPAQKVPLRRPG